MLSIHTIFCLFSCEMEHMGTFKCVFSNEAGSDETAGKVTVKPVRLAHLWGMYGIKFRPQFYSTESDN